MSRPEAEEVSWEVDGLQIAGLAWGEPSAPPVLALHGWLDNAASFAPLAERWPGVRLVALDLTGHGRSSWRSPDATYQVYDDLPQIHGVLQQLGWQQFSLLGHSRGAIIASLYAAAFPDSVQRLVLLDGLAPPSLPEAEFARQLRSFVQQRATLVDKPPPGYTDQASAIAARVRHGLGEAASTLIVTRNLRHDGEAWRLTTDPRLRGASAVKLTEGQIGAVLSSLAMPVLLVGAEQGLLQTAPERLAALNHQLPHARIEQVAGGHHFHMEGDVATLVGLLREFLPEDTDR